MTTTRIAGFRRCKGGYASIGRAGALAWCRAHNALVLVWFRYQLSVVAPCDLAKPKKPRRR